MGTKQTVKALFNIIVAGGALACVLQWLEIRPKDFTMLHLSLPHWTWLLAAITLFAWSLVDGFYRIKSEIFLPITIFKQKGSMRQPIIRIVDGVVGTEHDARTLTILLQVHVDGPAARIKSWKLELRREGKKWKEGFYNPVADPFFRVTEDSGKIRAEHATPLKPHVPGNGWIRFLVNYANANTLDRIFGATFHLIAVEETGKESSQTMPPGDWLFRAEAISQSGN